MTHPARFHPSIITAAAPWLTGRRVLDPFAGEGGVHRLMESLLHRPEVTVGVEIQPKWAGKDPRTIVGSALALPFAAGRFDAVFTSPTYGNRMADHHNAKDASRRHTYWHGHGGGLHPDNSGTLQWGPEYRAFHEQAWREARRVLSPRAVFVLNVKDHDRCRARQHVAMWHVWTLVRLGFDLLHHEDVDTPGMRHGANTEDRYPEQLYVLKLG